MATTAADTTIVAWKMQHPLLQHKTGRPSPLDYGWTASEAEKDRLQRGGWSVEPLTQAQLDEYLQSLG